MPGNFNEFPVDIVNFIYYNPHRTNIFTLEKQGGTAMNKGEIPVRLLPEIYQDLVRTVGMEAALTLGEEFGGMSLYLPKIESALRNWRDVNIRSEFTGANIPQLAKKYSLTSVRVRQILGVSREK
jgi:hypothetical protein